jgi:putative nucleotidyltransferase with HDIG domain
MAVPDRVEAASLLLQVHPSRSLVSHSAGVAEVAAYLAARTVAAGRRVDRALVEAAALLHDIDKALGTERGALPHGEASAAWLTRMGHGELATAVAGHPVTRLVEPGFDARALDLETAIVAYADKRVRQRLISMRARFDRWERRHPDTWNAERSATAWRHAQAIERRVCDAAGIRPEGVRRLRWARHALAAAQTGGR